MLAFYRIPKLLFTDAYFSGLDALAKTLYGLMLDRIIRGLESIKTDDVFFPYSDIEKVCKVVDPFRLDSELWED